ACPPSQPVFAGIAIFLVAIGLVGNAVIILLILVLKECSKSITNWYILQLALADTLFLLMLPFTASSELSGGWTYGVGMCKLKEAILFINYYASIYFLVVMSFDRYLAVTKAFSSSNWVVTLRRPRAAGIITAFGWVASIAISSPLFIYSTVGGCNICAYQFPMTELENCILVSTRTSLFFCLPLFAMCCFYGMIIRAIVTTQAGTGRSEVQACSHIHRVTLIVLSLVFLFLLSWLPWYTVQISLMYGINLHKEACGTLRYAVRLIAYLNSSLNPYFY
uniref:G-protein coupled receptors family 1 profile domain-containing protein n=1 Tax=Ciona savignyi TaxID=51511 RepID=H2Z6T6_CIOSA